MKDDYIESIDQNNQTIFHIAAKFIKISDSNIEKIIEVIDKSKKADEIIHKKARNGETVLLSFASTGHLKMLEYLEKKTESFNDCDNNGNNILHKIIESEGVTNNKIIPHVSFIIKKHPELILQYNQEGENPFMVAGKKGFNGVIGLMSTIYPIKLLDSSSSKSILHFAARSQIPDTIRYIVRNLHVDVNKQLIDGSTPLHWASSSGSLISYKELIKLGANPMICTKNKLNAIDIFLMNGCEKYIEMLSETPSFNYVLSTTNILTKIVSNYEAYSVFLAVTSQMDPSSIFACDSEGKTLVSLACANNNYTVVSDLLILGSDSEKPDNNGQNSLHICALNNSIGSSDRILNFLLYTKGSKSVSNILNASDSNGNIPMHFAVRKGFTGFVVHLLSACNDIDLTKANNYGHNPFFESVRKRYKNIAGILASYWSVFLKRPIEQLISCLTDELKRIWKDMSTSKEYLNGINIVNKIKTNSWPLIQQGKVKINSTPINQSKADIFIEKLQKIGIKIPKNFVEKCYYLISNPIFCSKIMDLINDKKVSLINLLLQKVVSMKSSKIRDITFLMIFHQISNDLINQFLELIDQINKFKFDESHPLFSWI